MPSIASKLARVMPTAELLTGADCARFAINTAVPEAVLRPRTPEQVSAALALADERGWSVSPRGGGTSLDLGNPLARLDLVLDMTALAAVLDYQPDDMTVTVQAGVTLAALVQLLGERHQLLPLDAPLPALATLGGAIATNLTGPRRLRFGTARDVVIGMQFATPQGGLARSGGRVVKNVAGYDLGKLHVGGLGCAGVITEATLKLMPAPARISAVIASFPDLPSARTAAAAMLHAQLFPAALELLNAGAASAVTGRTSVASGDAPWLLAALLHGVPAAVERATREIGERCTAAGALGTAPLDAPAAEALIDGIRDAGRSDEFRAALILRAAVLPSEVAAAVETLEQFGQGIAARPALIVRPSAGVVLGYWDSYDVAALGSGVRQARAALARIDGTLTIERWPGDAADEIERWGVDGADLALMHRLKDAYDPTHVLNAGRLAGGI